MTPAERPGALARDLAGRRVGRALLNLVPWVVYAFLWLPIVVLIVFSFNDADSVSVWRGFSLRWYRGLFEGSLNGAGPGSFRTELLLSAVRNSLFVATVSTVLATAIGTAFALAVTRGRFRGRRTFDALYYLPVVIPDITQGVSLAVFFRIAFEAIELVSGHRFVTGFATIIIGHVSFNIAFVLITVRARLQGMNPSLEEAAQDLGANRLQTFWRVTLPGVAPGILAGALLAFTLSLDDFVITFFTAGVGTTTLPLFVYGLLKQRVPPEINAVSALMILASIVLVSMSLLLQRRTDRG
ncbi:MAG: ABC transporter permease [Trueperaceae bacterium]|nr:ABC transporter permease [Trueperaceae bacterium]